LAVERFPTIRQSLLSSFDNCSLTSRFDAEYRRGWSTPWQARGQMFHRFAAEALREMARLNEDEIPVDAALEILRDVLRQDKADRTCPKCQTDDIKPGIELETGMRECGNGHLFETELVNVPLAMVKDLYWIVIKWAHDNSFDIGALADVEQRLQATVAYPHPHGGYVRRVLTGQLDSLLVEGPDLSHAIVLDWKDTWGLPAEHDPGEDDDVSFGGYFQQRFYAWLVMANYPSVEKVTLREYYVRFSAPREASLTREELPELERELGALAERFDRLWDEYLRMPEEERSKKSPFRPTPGKHCNWCIRPAACPIPAFARLDGRIVDEHAAEQFARQVLVAESVLKQGRAALRAYAEVRGPIPIHDAKGARAMGFRESVRVERPSLEDIAAAEQQKGGPLNSVEVRALYKTRRSTRFTSFVPKGVDEGAAEAELQAQLEASIEAAREAQERAGVEPEKPDNVVQFPKPK
jgi:hypothetical protein